MAWRARWEALIAKRQGDRCAFFKPNVKLEAKLLRLVWGVWRSGRPYEPVRALPASGPRPAARRPRRALRQERGRGAVPLTLREVDGRVHFALREPAEAPRPRR